MPKSSKTMPKKTTSQKKKTSNKKQKATQSAKNSSTESSTDPVENVESSDTNVIQEVSAPASAPTENVEEKPDQFIDLEAKLAQVFSLVKEIRASVKTLKKDYTKLAKSKTKKRGGKKSNPNRAPSGFAKPGPISAELCKFIGVDKGTELARTYVTKFMTNYIKENTLQNPENRKEILPDTNMKKLLNLGKGETITFFTMQKFMAPHFTKNQTAAAAK